MRLGVLWEAPRAFHEKNKIPAAQPLAEVMEANEHCGNVAAVATELKIRADQLEAHPSMQTDVRVIRAQLMVEELGETLEAMQAGNVVEMADGLMDLLYVIGGTIETFGLGPAVSDLFADVHRANMEKTNRDGAVRVRDKGENWTPPRIKHILEMHDIDC